MNASLHVIPAEAGIVSVIPAKAGIQGFPANARCALVPNALDPRLRGDDGNPLVVPAEAGTQGFPPTGTRGGQ